MKFIDQYQKWWSHLSVIGLVGAGLLVGQQAAAASCEAASIRWASSSNRVYVSGADTVCTVPEIATIADKAELRDEGNGMWFVGSNIVMEDGARLNVHGPQVSELRLKSNNTGDPSNDIVYLRAYWGTIDIADTTVTSWDEGAGGPDTEYGSNKRSYIQVKSFLDGSTARESRMDISNSNVGHLGHKGAEAYGLSWKVLGGTGNHALYDLVEVYGDISNSRIHHNYFGVYTYGLLGGQWIGNEIDNNVVYGLDPHDDSDEILIDNNNVHHNGAHGIICSRRCNDLVISNNHSHSNGGNGIMLHRDANDSLVENNTVLDNTDSGIAIFDSHRNAVRNNTSSNNGRGIRLSVGSAENFVTDNIFENNVKYGAFFYKGSDAPTSGDGRPHHNVFRENEFTGSGINGLKLKQSDDNDFIANTFIDNGKDLLFEDGDRNLFEGNLVEENSHYGLRLKFESTDNRIFNNTFSHSGKAGVYLASGSDDNEVDGNTMTNHGEYGMRLVGSSNNLIVNNTIEENRRGINLRDDAEQNVIRNNQITDNDQHSFFIQNASDNRFLNNDMKSNGRYGYAKEDSHNSIEDIDWVELKLGDMDSSFDVISNTGVVYDISDDDVTTVIEPTRTVAHFTRAMSAGAVTFEN